MFSWFRGRSRDFRGFGGVVATTGQHLHKLTAEDAAAGDLFSHSVAINGDQIVVGAHGDDDAGTDSGSAYVFDATTCQQLLRLMAADAEAGDAFDIEPSLERLFP